MKLQTGDILHCTGKGIISRMIMWATKSNFSHTAVFLEIWGQPYIIEAQKNGVNVKTLEEWQKKYNYKYIVHRNPCLINTHRYSIRAMSIVGVTGYDFISLLLRQPLSLITGRWARERKPEDKMYCSEYAMWTHGVSGSKRMTPQDAHDHCIKNKWTHAG